MYNIVRRVINRYRYRLLLRRPSVRTAVPSVLSDDRDANSRRARTSINKCKMTSIVTRARGSLVPQVCAYDSRRSQLLAKCTVVETVNGYDRSTDACVVLEKRKPCPKSERTKIDSTTLTQVYPAMSYSVRSPSRTESNHDPVRSGPV